MSDLRIALVTQGFFSAGGVQTVARWLRGQLQLRGYQVDVFDLASSSTDHRSRRALRPATWLRHPRLVKDDTEPRVWRVGSVLAEAEPLRYLPHGALTRALRSYDVVQVVAGGPALALAASRAGVPVALQVATRVAWERSSISGGGKIARSVRRLNTRIVDLLEPRAIASTDAVMVENASMLEYSSRYAPGRVVLAPPGIDTTNFRPRPEGWNRSGPVLAVGRLGDYRKGYDRVIDAYRILCSREDHPPELVLAGRGQLSADSRSRLASMPHNARVRVLSDVGDDDLQSLYRDASMFVQGSHEEGLGIAVIEAMASGLPVAATDTAGTRETVIDGETGFLIPQGPAAAESLADAITSIARATDDAMSQAARRRSAEFSSEATIQRYIAAYRDITAGARSANS